MPNRRRARAFFLVPLVALAISACGPPDPEGIVLIVIDTLRADHLGTYGYSRPTSERLDAWAQQGRVFDHALSTSSWTLPSMASMLTGQLPKTHLAGQKRPGENVDAKHALLRRTPVSLDVPNLAERLSAHGFATAAFSANSFLSPKFGLARGFDVYKNAPPNRAGRETVNKAIAWLEDIEGPFFLLVHLMEPHLPYKAPEQFRGRFDDEGEEWRRVKGPSQIRRRLRKLTEDEKQRIGRRYDEEILAADHALGILRDRLEANGLLERTLVVLTSDHGEELFDHGGYEHGHSLFQEVTRIPLIFWGPGIRPGRDETPVSTIDLPSTLLDAMNVDRAGFTPGRTLWPLLRRGESPPPRALVVESTLYGPREEGLLEWPMKLIVDKRSGTVRLYDLDADPGETVDLTGEQPEVVEKMLALLSRQMELAESKAGRAEQPVELTPELERELKALGYIED